MTVKTISAPIVNLSPVNPTMSAYQSGLELKGDQITNSTSAVGSVSVADAFANVTDPVRFANEYAGVNPLFMLAAGDIAKRSGEKQFATAGSLQGLSEGSPSAAKAEHPLSLEGITRDSIVERIDLPPGSNYVHGIAQILISKSEPRRINVGEKITLGHLEIEITEQGMMSGSALNIKNNYPDGMFSVFLLVENGDVSNTISPDIRFIEPGRTQMIQFDDERKGNACGFVLGAYTIVRTIEPDGYGYYLIDTHNFISNYAHVGGSVVFGGFTGRFSDSEDQPSVVTNGDERPIYTHFFQRYGNIFVRALTMSEKTLVGLEDRRRGTSRRGGVGDDFVAELMRNARDVKSLVAGGSSHSANGLVVNISNDGRAHVVNLGTSALHVFRLTEEVDARLRQFIVRQNNSHNFGFDGSSAWGLGNDALVKVGEGEDAEYYFLSDVALVSVRELFRAVPRDPVPARAVVAREPVAEPAEALTPASSPRKRVNNPQLRDAPHFEVDRGSEIDLHPWNSALNTFGLVVERENGRFFITELNRDSRVEIKRGEIYIKVVRGTGQKIRLQDGDSVIIDQRYEYKFHNDETTSAVQSNVPQSRTDRFGMLELDLSASQAGFQFDVVKFLSPNPLERAEALAIARKVLQDVGQFQHFPTSYAAGIFAAAKRHGVDEELKPELDEFARQIIDEKLGENVDRVAREWLFGGKAHVDKVVSPVADGKPRWPRPIDLE